MSSRSYFYRFLLCLMLGGAFQTTQASTAVVPLDEEMVVESRAIVTGRVMEVSTELDASKGVVFTYVRLMVETVLKGQIFESEVVLRELGGETSEFGTMIYGMPRFEEGQDVFLYLNTWPDGSLRVHQGFLGKFNVTRSGLTGLLEIARQDEGSSVHIKRSSVGAVTDRSDLEAYSARIISLVKANTQRGERFEQTHYSDIPVLTVPPGFDKEREFGKIRPQWALLNPARPLRWFEPDSNGDVVFYVNPASAPKWDYQDDIRQALNAWSSAAGVKMRAILAGTTSGCGAQTTDGKNSISFNNCDGFFAPSSGCSGLLAVGGIVRYSTKDTKTVNGMTFYRGIEANVSFNPFALCNFVNRCQLQESLTHEIGHALGLGHSSDSNATMNAFAHFDGRCASVDVDDTTGITRVYPGGSSGGVLDIRTASDLGVAKVDRDFAATLEAKGGAGSYRWTIGGGQTPPGLLISQSGFVYGRPEAPGAYNFLAQVHDSSNGSVQKTFSLLVQPPSPAPFVVSVEYRNKKVFVFGTHFESDAKILLNGVAVKTVFDGSALRTKKKAKLAGGVHTLCILNADGKRSNDFSFVVQ
ncbi:MAG TPA: matrixin family metalloprotease [Blastocatellia bacterium]|nr:matrixin family metalloprotease [Blastocatellia bacterium]